MCSLGRLATGAATHPFFYYVAHMFRIRTVLLVLANIGHCFFKH